MLRKSREEILKDFKAQIAQGKILVGVGAGTGITANPWQASSPTAMPTPSYRKWAAKCSPS